MKKLLQRYTPNPDDLKNHKYLGWLGKHLHNPSLWNFNRKCISKAFAIGLFCAFIPMPFQMFLAAPVAVIFSANLPVAVALVWITNPITIPPIFYACYQLGVWILGTDINISLQVITEMFTSFEIFLDVLSIIWQPFLLGCLIVSVVSSIMGYFTIQLIYRLKIHKRQRRD